MQFPVVSCNKQKWKVPRHPDLLNTELWEFPECPKSSGVTECSLIEVANVLTFNLTTLATSIKTHSLNHTHRLSRFKFFLRISVLR